jgi:1-deoxy-D-xylulose-5-phosphate synthase
MSGADGMNDTTHLCIFDIPMMSNIPNLVYLCPTCVEEAIAMMDYAIDQTEHPIAIRIPNGVVHRNAAFDKDYSRLNTYKVDKRGSKVALIGLGSYYALAEEAAAKLAKSGIDATIVNPRFATGVDNEVLEGLCADHQVVVTLENGVIDGGFGEKIARFYGSHDMKVLVKGLKKEFYDKVPYGELMKRNRLTPAQIAEDVKTILTSP